MRSLWTRSKKQSTNVSPCGNNDLEMTLSAISTNDTNRRNIQTKYPSSSTIAENRNDHPAGTAPLPLNDSSNHSHHLSSLYTEESPFYQYLNHIENDCGVKSFESVGRDATLDARLSELPVVVDQVGTPALPSRNDIQDEEERLQQQQELILVQSPQGEATLDPPHSSPRNRFESHYYGCNSSIQDGGSVSDMYAIAVMQYDPTSGNPYFDDDISTLGDESMIRRSTAARTLWTVGQEEVDGAANKLETSKTTIKQQSKEPTPLSSKCKKSSKTSANKMIPATTKGIHYQKSRKTPQSTSSSINQKDSLNEISIDKSKSRSGNTFLLKSYFSKSYSKDEEADPERKDIEVDSTDENKDQDGVESAIQMETGRAEDDTIIDDEPLTFLHNNKWIIVRFMICVAVFLFLVAAAAFTLGFLYVKDSSSMQGLFDFFAGDNSDETTTPSSLQQMGEDLSFPPAMAPPPSIFDQFETTVPSEPLDDTMAAPSLQNVKETHPTTDNTLVDPDRQDIRLHLWNLLAEYSSGSLSKMISSDTTTTITFSEMDWETIPTTPHALAFDWMVNDPMYWMYAQPTRILQRWVLALLYYSTNGPTSWETENFVMLPDNARWMNYSNECRWMSTNRGVDDSICNSNGEVSALHLRNVGLNGTIPTEVGLLSNSLGLLLANGNPMLGGTIPTELGLLTNMEKLQLSSNNLHGSIPSEIGSGWPRLTIAALGNNRLTGTLPTELGLWTSLRTLGLQGNQLSGTLPTEFGFLQQMESLSMERNYFSGTIPSEWSSLWWLQSLSIHENRLTGDMPDDVCNLNYLEDLKADCAEEMYCSCCSECY